MTGWGAEQLTREELLRLGSKLRRAWDASAREAKRSPGTGQRWRFFDVAREMRWLWGDAVDELSLRELGGRRVDLGAEAKFEFERRLGVSREPEAGS